MLASSAPARAQDVRGGFLSLASASVSDLEMDRRFGYPAISLEDFRRLGFTDVEARAGVVTAMVEGASLEFYIGSPFFRFRRTVLQLPNPPYQADGTYWVPASLVTGQATSRGQPVGSGATAAASAVSGSGGESGRTTDVAASPAPSGPPRPLRVAIDPGHGGRDPGTTGRRGTREKNVVLAIAKLVHAELSAMSGVEPMLTRDRDVLIPLKKRSQLAVAQEADLFLSIHANASRSRKAQGFETFFLGEARTELSRELAIRENSAVQYEEEGEGIRPEDVQFILAQLNLTSNQRESGTFGGYVQNSLRGTLRTRSASSPTIRRRSSCAARRDNRAWRTRSWMRSPPIATTTAPGSRRRGHAERRRAGRHRNQSYRHPLSYPSSRRGDIEPAGRHRHLLA
jgi:N-acetylmuramoyl-L-alanine amidase